MPFQSRLGKIPWIEPCTKEKIKELADYGIKRLQVISPAFATYCLEMLEDITIEIRELFLMVENNLSILPASITMNI